MRFWSCAAEQTGGAQENGQRCEMEKVMKQCLQLDRIDGKWLLEMALSLLIPLLIIVFQPIGLSLRQSIVVAGVLLTIIWWSSGIVKKIPASFFLIAVFCLAGHVDYRTVFSFPLSETFPMIVITYLFSQAISNSGLIDRIFQPVLLRFVHTPFQCLIAIVVLFYLTMYVIPQPLARLIIVAAMFEQFLRKTTLPDQTREVLMYAVFLLAAVVNMSAKDADMIMNHVAAGFSEIAISNGMWMRSMLVPTLICCALIVGVFMLLFRKEMRGGKIEAAKEAVRSPFTSRQKASLIIFLTTVLLWMTNQIHGINNTLITVVATLLLFGIGVLHREDLKTIDVTTLIFLTAAFAIGGVMKSCGAADKVFGVLTGIFPEKFSAVYLLLMVSVSMALHMILGSNTTTLSVVVPGMMILCGDVVASPVIVFAAVVSVSFHAILPFHSVSMMIGASDGYFPSRYVTKMGIPATVLVYAVAAGVFLPYWKLIGLL